MNKLYALLILPVFLAGLAYAPDDKDKPSENVQEKTKEEKSSNDDIAKNTEKLKKYRNKSIKELTSEEKQEIKKLIEEAASMVNAAHKIKLPEKKLSDLLDLKKIAKLIADRFLEKAENRGVFPEDDMLPRTSDPEDIKKAMAYVETPPLPSESLARRAEYIDTAATLLNNFIINADKATSADVVGRFKEKAKEVFRLVLDYMEPRMMDKAIGNERLEEDVRRIVRDAKRMLSTFGDKAPPPPSAQPTGYYYPPPGYMMPPYGGMYPPQQQQKFAPEEDETQKKKGKSSTKKKTVKEDPKKQEEQEKKQEKPQEKKQEEQEKPQEQKDQKPQEQTQKPQEQKDPDIQLTEEQKKNLKNLKEEVQNSKDLLMEMSDFKSKGIDVKTGTREIRTPEEIKEKVEEFYQKLNKLPYEQLAKYIQMKKLQVRSEAIIRAMVTQIKGEGGISADALVARKEEGLKKTTTAEKGQGLETPAK